MKSHRLTMSQALVRYLAVQRGHRDGKDVPLFAGVWAIFGHGNVAGLGEALHAERERLPTYRAHNEQAMALTAIAFAKAARRRQMMACTSSIGPGATNMVTAAAVAHADRLPVLFLPGDVFANRRPDPVLQQIEAFEDGTVSANDCFRPVSRYFDRISRPEQIMSALPRALSILIDPARAGPVTLALCQDTQTEAFDYPVEFFEPRLWVPRRIRPDAGELAAAAALLKAARKPLIVAGGGVIYAEAQEALLAFAERFGIPFAETQAGKGAIASTHPLNVGAIGVTGTSAANALARESDLIVAIGTRLQDFTTGSWTLLAGGPRRLIALNVQAFDASKQQAQPLVADAREGLTALYDVLSDSLPNGAWVERAQAAKATWSAEHNAAIRPTNAQLPSDAEVIGAVQRTGLPTDIVVCAAGGLPGELHKLWQTGAPGGYHLEYGYSCMGYEIAGGLGVKLAESDREVIVMVGDGSYLMMNSEIATSVMLGQKLIVVVLDNRGFGCITRLQMATGGERFNNLLEDARHMVLPDIDFRAHAASLGAHSVKVASLADLESAMATARASARTSVIVIDTDPMRSTAAGGHWWDVAVPEVSARAEVAAARKSYDKALADNS